MRIDSGKLKKSLSDPPADCANLIQQLCSQNDEDLRITLSNIKTWTVGKCELYHWVAVLDRFDEILEKATATKGENNYFFIKVIYS
jgi:E3 ubiquitin-protein ligase HUWE1